jgi:hypothetical protein
MSVDTRGRRAAQDLIRTAEQRAPCPLSTGCAAATATAPSDGPVWPSPP